MQLKRILVGVDFSEPSELAVTQALNLARKTEAELILIHAGTVPQHPIGLSPRMEGAAAHFERLLREQLAETRLRLDELRERLGAGGVRVSQMLLDAFPDNGLAAAAVDLDADLVVVGTHGRTGFDRFLMGSVAERTVRLCTRSVLVARPRSRGEGGFKKILVPVDFSETSDRVVDGALTFAAKGATVELFHVWELPGASWLTVDVAAAKGGQWRDELRAAALAQGDELIQRHWRVDDAKLTFDQVEDRPARGIQQRLEAGDHDLVVMGSHGRKGLKRFVLGSVAEATVRYAPCSVAVVHANSEKGGE